MRRIWGTSGAVITGFQYAIEKGYDWIWVLDADSALRKDALEKLIELYGSFPDELREQIRVLASSPGEPGEGASRKHRGWIRFTIRGYELILPDPEQLFYECDANVWTGSLFKLAAVSKTGLPPADYVLDMGEFQCGYLGKLRGYRTFIHTGSVVEHNIGGHAAAHFRSHRFGPILFADAGATAHSLLRRRAQLFVLLAI